MLSNLRLTECVKCFKITSQKEMDFNAQFAMFKNKEICNQCAEKIEDSIIYS